MKKINFRSKKFGNLNRIPILHIHQKNKAGRNRPSNLELITHYIFSIKQASFTITTALIYF